MAVEPAVAVVVVVVVVVAVVVVVVVVAVVVLVILGPRLKLLILDFHTSLFYANCRAY